MKHERCKAARKDHLDEAVMHECRLQEGHGGSHQCRYVWAQYNVCGYAWKTETK